jgi:hypothetical protein
MVTVERRVVVLSRGGRLGGFAMHVLSDGNGTTFACLESPAELADWKLPPVDVVLLDFPRRNRGIVYRQLRQRYRGPVLALLDPDEDGGLPAGRGPLAILNRPFSGEELSAVLSVLLAPPVEEPAAPSAQPAGEKTEETAVLPAEVVAALAGVDALPAGVDALPDEEGAPAAGVGEVAGPAASPGRSRWWWLGGRRLRRWEIIVGAAGIVLLGISLSVQSGCQSTCAGAAEGGGPKGPVDPPIAVGPGFADSPNGPDGTASTGAVSGPGSGGRAAVSSGAGSLVTAAGGTGSGTFATRPLLVSPASAIATGGGLVVSGPSQPPASQPPPTSPPPTSPPPTTAPPPTSPPPTTEPPPPTTEPPPPTTEPPPPTTEPPPPTTEPPPPTTEPPPPTTEPPPPTTEPPPPTTEPPPTTALATGGS